MDGFNDPHFIALRILNFSYTFNFRDTMKHCSRYYLKRIYIQAVFKLTSIAYNTHTVVVFIEMNQADIFINFAR